MTRSRRNGRTGGKDLALALVVVVAVSAGVVVGVDSLFGDDEAAVPVAVDADFGEIDREAFEDVPLAVDEAALEQALSPARPVDPQVVERYEVDVPEPLQRSCLYYEAADGLPRDLYRFCFDDGRLVDKEYVE